MQIVLTQDNIGEMILIWNAGKATLDRDRSNSWSLRQRKCSSLQVDTVTLRCSCCLWNNKYGWVKNPCYCSKLAQNAFKERMAVVRFTRNVWGKHKNKCCLQKAVMFTQKWSDWRSEEGRAGGSSDVKILIPFYSLPKPPLIRETCEGFWKPV